MLYMILYLPFTFKEKASGFKNLQNIPSIVYWIALFLSDIIVHAIVVFVIMILTTYDREGLAFSPDELKDIALLFFMYGVTCLIVVYITSQCFNNLSSALMFLNYLQIFSLFGIIMMSSSKEAMKEYESFITLFHIFPDFALKHSLKAIHERHKFERNHIKVGNSKDSAVYISSLNEFGFIFDLTQFYVANLLVFIGSAIFLFLFVENQQLMEKFGYFCSKLQFCWCLNREDKSEIESIQMEEIDDPDVKNEKMNVDSLIRDEKVETEAMVVSQLEKIYGGDFKAVQGISFSVKRGECFGLLGK